MTNEEKILTLIEKMGSQLDKMDSRMEQMDSRMEKMDSRISGIETQITDIQSDQKTMRGQVDKMHESICVIENEHGKKINALFDSIPIAEETSKKVDKLQDSVDKLKFGEEVIRFVNAVERQRV